MDLRVMSTAVPPTPHVSLMAFDASNYATDLLEDDTADLLASFNTTHLPNGILGDLSGAHSYYYMENAEEMLLPWKNNPNFVPIVLTNVLTFIVGLVGNIIVISTMSREHGERSVTSMFLVSLAVADLLLVAICAPLETMGYFINTLTKGGRLCQLQSYVEMLSAVASVLNLTAVSLERYLVIVYPMKSRSFCTLHNCRRALIFVWIFALLLTAPVIVTRDSVTYVYYNNQTSVAVHYCMDTGDIGHGGEGLGSYSGFLIALYQLIIMLVLPLLLMIVCYSRVIKELWLSTKQITAMTRDSSPPRLTANYPSAAAQSGWGPSGPTGINTISGRVHRSMRQHPHQSTGSTAVSTKRKGAKCAQAGRSGDGAKQARKQVIKMLILVVVLFLVCWGPRLLLNAIIKWGLTSYDATVYQLRIAFYLLPFVHSCINPVIYGFMSTNFRRTMVRCCNRQRRCCRSCCCCNDDTEQQHVRPHSIMLEMSNGNGGFRRHVSCSAQTEATLATTPATRHSSLYRERYYTTEEV